MVWVDHTFAEGFLPVDAFEPESLEQTLIPKRRLSDRDIPQGLFKVLGPHHASVPAAIGVDIEYLSLDVVEP
jgi:hypothetical protein